MVRLAADAVLGLNAGGRLRHGFAISRAPLPRRGRANESANSPGARDDETDHEGAEDVDVDVDVDVHVDVEADGT